MKGLPLRLLVVDREKKDLWVYKEDERKKGRCINQQTIEAVDTPFNQLNVNVKKCVASIFKRLKRSFMCYIALKY